MGNQPVGHAICGLPQPARRRQLVGLLLHLPFHQEFLLLRSLDVIDPLSFIYGVWWTSLSAPIYPYCPPHLLYCVLSTLMPPISFLLFMIAGPEKFSMFTRSLTCLSRQFGCEPVTFILKLTSALASWWWIEWSFRTDLFASSASLLLRCSTPLCNTL